MHRFYLPPEQCQDRALSLSPSDSHHALHVLRVRGGDRVLVLDGAGREFLAEVRRTAKDAVLLEVIETRLAPGPTWQLTLLQAIPKGKLIESIIQKATELGASRVVPLVTERTVAQVEKADAARKTAKWQGIAVESIKQCGSPWLPLVTPPTTPQEFLAPAEPFELALVASLRTGSIHPRTCFDAFRSRLGRHPRSVCIWVGPEGDFTNQELDLIESTGAAPITLGPLVLRAETAATYCLSVLSYELRSA